MSHLKMDSQEKSGSTRSLPAYAEGKPARRLWRDVGIGCVLGSVAGMAFHLFSYDSKFASHAYTEWSQVLVKEHFDGLQAYKTELIVLLIGIAAFLARPVSVRAWRLARSWWAGIVSITIPVVACVTFAIVELGRNSPKMTIAGGFVLLVVVIVREYWSQRPRSSQPSALPLHLNIPIQKRDVSQRRRWEASSNDDPIIDWQDDMIGRAAVVETLALHALRLSTPVVALNGEFGDGKSSVLNLLKKAVEGQAIVISFNAWLPGSEATLATDLFIDITSECRKYFYIPQLRKQALAYARTLTRSVSFLAGLKELLPAQSQLEEVQELRESFSRIPRRIIVLLDEIDRMQRGELLVLLKILRGASSIPNTTFICAFSDKWIRAELREEAPDYLEKFFPVSVNLSTPDQDMIGRCLQDQLKRKLAEQGWFKASDDEKKFIEPLEKAWNDALSKVCTNLRKAGLLVNDILTAARGIVGEVNPFDLVAIEAVRRFFPDVYRLVRSNALFMTMEESSWSKDRYMREDRKKAAGLGFFGVLDSKIEGQPESTSVQVLLSLLFPDYAKTNERTSVYGYLRRTTQETAAVEKRICDADYFPIYFRAAVPEEMFSNAELDEIVDKLNAAESEEDVQRIFSEMLDSIPPNHPRREDFLWKLNRPSIRLTFVASERLAYAAAVRADSYAYDMINTGEAARALNLVFSAAQSVSTTPGAQRILEGAMARTSDDTFAIRIVEYTVSSDRNQVLTDFSNVDVDRVKAKFMERMRNRYSPQDIQTVKIVHCDWRAFRFWVNNSDADCEIEQEFWRRFIGDSRKKLAQAISVIYPRMAWTSDPRPTIDQMFPMTEFARLLAELPDHEELDETEKTGIAGMVELISGKYPSPLNA
jgi:KAP family P-loop domain